MKYGLTGIVALGLTALGAEPAVAQHGPVGHYTARLSARDHFNSSGVRLTTVAAIIRQDRANVHRFGLIDGEDQPDNFFGVAQNRASLERLLARGSMGPGVARAIVNGEPLIHVDIYPGYVVVTVL